MHRILDESSEVCIRDASHDDVMFLGPNLRPEDLAECRALTERTPTEALLDSYMESYPRCFTVTVGGEPCIMLGVAPHPTEPETGIPWLLASPAMYKIAAVFVQHQHEVLEGVSHGYAKLINITSNTTQRGLGWLAKMGFTIGPILPQAGRNGEDLIVFVKEL